MSAIVFNCNHIQKSSPLSPLVNLRGAMFVEDLNLVFPKPPFPPIAAVYSSFSFLKSKIKNYKLQASIYKLFESSDFEDPKNIVENRYTIIEHILSNKTTEVEKGDSPLFANM